jgi:hypothetical protein
MSSFEKTENSRIVFNFDLIMKRNYTNIILAAILILLAAMMRIVNREIHLYNLAPIGAVGLFAGAVIKDKRYAYLLPLISMFIADLYFQLFTSVTGFYGFEQVLVYVGMGLVTFLGTKMGNVTGIKVAGYSIIGSFIFFVVSNFGSYLTGMWGYGFKGLATTYTMAIPFFKNTVVSELVGSIALFGLYFIGQKAIAPKMQKA